MEGNPAQYSQGAFPFVVPLEMDGQWRLMREGETFDPEWTTLVELDAGRASVTYFQQGDGGIESFRQAGTYRVEGGWLTIELADQVDGLERIVGAAPVVPDVIAVMRSRWYDDEPGEIARDTFTLIRNELADAVRIAEASWANGTLGNTH